MKRPHLEDELSQSIRVFVVEQEGVQGVGRRRFEEQQEELVFGWTALQQTEQHLQQRAQLQHTQHIWINPLHMTRHMSLHQSDQYMEH